MGADRWRTIEHDYSLNFIERGLSAMMDRGDIQRVPTSMLASTVFGACCEATLTIAAADDAQAAKNEATDIVIALLQGLKQA